MTRMSVQVRAVLPADAAGVATILNEIIAAGTYTVLDTEVSSDDERRFIESFPPRGIFHVAVAGGAVVGFQNVEPFATFTRAFDHVGVIGTFVGLESRRRGIGRRLFAATFAEARRRGFRKLIAYVRADNPAALAAYLAHGFRVVGTARAQALIGGRYVDETFIEKELVESWDLQVGSET